MAPEEEFGSDIPEEEAEKLQTVGSVIEYVEKIYLRHKLHLRANFSLKFSVR